MAKSIMIQGTMSGVGKSLLTAGLCRIFRQDGYRVAPFKSQNMALNSFVTEDGLEMGRAQVMQAEAAGIAPDVRMNPILLKPTTDVGSQVIARGEVTVPELDRIHEKMETLLGKEGAYLDGLYYCPHHPHKGYAGEIPELKIECECRKPKPGMLYQAAADFNIDLAASWMIGDGENDIRAGQAAGVRTVLIGEGSFGQTITVSSIEEAVEKCLAYQGQH